jgi:hypothetical protein
MVMIDDIVVLLVGVRNGQERRHGARGDGLKDRRRAWRRKAGTGFLRHAQKTPTASGGAWGSRNRRGAARII